MPRRLQEILEDIGLDRRDARVYLAVLQHPEINLADIARLTLISRMSCYGIVHGLLQRGFLDVLAVKKGRMFIAVPPHKILERLSRHAHAFEEALPRFEKHARATLTAQRVRFFEGTDGIRAVFRRILDEKRPLAAITCIEDMHEVAHTYFDEFIKRRFQQYLKVRLLTNRTKEALRLKETDASELRETRFLPEEYRFHTAEYIFGDSVAIISLKQDPPAALIIEDPEIAKTHAMYFDLLWRQAEGRQQ